MDKIKTTILMLALTLMCGCAQITETVKVIWGSSTKALEGARAGAITKSYQCSFAECFDAVLALGYMDDSWADPVEKEEDDVKDDEEKEKKEDVASKPVHSGHFEVFIKNRKKRHIVVMGVPGNVDTTEVGIFFTSPLRSTIKLEVASLSSSAKRTVAETIFRELDLVFSAAE